MFSWIGYLIVAWLIGDFVTGFFHWVVDQYTSEKMPVIGRLVAGPNSRHHASPTAFLKANYWQRNKTNIAIALIVAMIAGLFHPLAAIPFLFASQANEIHGWAHQRCSSIVRVIQETELLASVRHHAQHHVDPFNRRYCVMSGWLNPFLDYVRIWDRMEYAIFASTGIPPLHWTANQSN